MKSKGSEYFDRVLLHHNQTTPTPSIVNTQLIGLCSTSGVCCKNSLILISQPESGTNLGER